MMKSNWAVEFARAIRNFKYEKHESGILLTKQNVNLGGIFSTQVDDGPWVANKNTVMLPFLDNLLDVFFNNVSAPSACYVAPFKNNTTPSSSLTASNFASTLSEYTGYTQGTRPGWTSNGASAGQTVSNSNAVATFTVGASAVNVTGAALLTSAVKGGTSGILVAASLFDVANSLNAGSTLKVSYALAAAPAA